MNAEQDGSVAITILAMLATMTLLLGMLALADLVGGRPRKSAKAVAPSPPPTPLYVVEYDAAGAEYRVRVMPRDWSQRQDDSAAKEKRA